MSSCNVVIAGDVWRRHRKIITPAFHFNILEKFVPIFNKNAQVFVDKMMTLLGKDVDVTMPVSFCALDIISGKYKKICKEHYTKR